MFWIYLALVNAATFGAFAFDKLAARNEWRRVPEFNLLTLAFIGGTPGAIAAQQLLRHKSSKQPFGEILIAIAALHTVGAAIFLMR